MSCRVTSRYNRGAIYIGRSAAFATLAEALSAPSPGLVSRFDNGSHSDMNIFSFGLSSTLLTNHFIEAAEQGITSDIKEFKNATQKQVNRLYLSLKEIGQTAEREMWEVVNVNTHKGNIYLLILLCCAAGICFKEKDYNIRSVCKIAGCLARPHIEKEFSETGFLEYGKLSTGLRAFIDFGLKGIRGEVLSDFRLCRNVGIPAIEQSFSKGAGLNDALSHCLFVIMAQNDDTTLLNRSYDLNNINAVHSLCSTIIKAGSLFTEEGRKKIRDFQKTMVINRLSPGGSADLVSGSFFLYLIKCIHEGRGALGQILTRDNKESSYLQSVCGRMGE